MTKWTLGKIPSPTSASDDRCNHRQRQPNIEDHPLQNHRKKKWKEYWGDRMKQKKSNMIRIAVLNINHIGQMCNSPKSEALREFIEDKDVDIIGLSELGVNWKKLEEKHSLWERTEPWFSMRRLAVGYNSADKLSMRSQYGGTAIMAIDKAAHKVTLTGADNSGLGRWAWINIRGKRNQIYRLVSVYCPVRPSAMKGCQGQDTVYAQHLRHTSKEPIKAFWEDLKEDIAQWQKEGNKLIIMGDWNSDVRTTVTDFMMHAGLVEVITTVHGNDGPPTMNRGSKAIDGIFASPLARVESCGYLPFGATPGDHRCLWMDIPIGELLGYEIPDLPTAKARNLQLQDPRTVNKYQKDLHQLFLRHKIYPKILAIRDTLEYPLQKEHRQSINILNAQMKDDMIIAAKKCRKKKMGGKKFSDTLKKARLTIYVWILVERRLKGCHVHAKTILRSQKKAGIRNTLVTLEKAQAYKDKAYKRYKILRKQDEQLSLQFREKLAQARAKEGNHTAASEIRSLNLREAQRKEARRIRRALGKNKGSGTTMIQVQHQDEVEEVTNQTEMEAIIIKENEAKYHQTEDRCPLLKGQLLEDIGLLGDGPRVNDILAGTYECPEGTPDSVIQWIQHMAIPDPSNRHTILSTLADYRNGWKKVKEYTASGELHFGHYKAGARHEMISWAHFVMAGIPRATGFVPDRWKQCTDVMLLKKEGLYLVNKLRTIVLLESDFNMENKRLGRESMQLALNQNMIAEEQYSRPGRSAQDNALNKRLMFDYQRYRRQPFGMCACDLKACYDRIVHNAASLALQRVGVRQSDIVSMFGTVQQLTHKVRTAFGDSAETYRNDNPSYPIPAQGTCQGNGSGPSVWSIICSTIFDLLHKNGYGSSFCYAISRGLYNICGFAYVDDCDLFYLGDTPDNIIVGMQTMLTLWDELMEVTGAAIAPDKCWWYLVDFTWKNGKWKYSNTANTSQLKVRNKDGIEEQLEHQTFAIAKEMLGVYLAPNGQQKTQLGVMKSKAKAWSTHIRASNLNQYSVWRAMNTTIIKTLEYPLVATTLTAEELKSLMFPVLSAGLTGSGICRYFPRAVLYGPLNKQGLGMNNIYHVQCIRHITDIIDHSWKNTPSGKFITANIEACKLEIGLLGKIFDRQCEAPWHSTPNSWIYDTFQYCQKYHIRFREPGADLLPKRDNDRSIMEVIATLPFSTTQLKAVNRCRLRLRVTTLSDITTGDGKYVQANAFKRAPAHTHDRYAWPAQGPLPSTDWKIWENALRAIYCNDTLHPPLGDWTLPKTEFISTGQFFFTQQNTLVRRRNKAQWEYFKHCNARSGRHTRFNITPHKVRRRPQGTLHRTTVQQTGEWLITQGSKPMRPTINPPLGHNPKKKFLQRIKQFADYKWICQRIQGTEHINEILEAIESGDLIGISDGSYSRNHGLGSAQWAMVDEVTGATITGGGMVPGNVSDQSSYRSEAAGLLGLMIVLAALDSLVKNTIKPITIACDGESALIKSLDYLRTKFSSSHKTADIISRIMDIKEHHTRPINTQHVRGHQDDHLLELTFLEQCNVKMDEGAKQWIAEAVATGYTPPLQLPNDEIGLTAVTIRGIPVNSTFSKTLAEHVAGQDLIQWWIRQGRVTQTTAHKIDWTLVGKTMKASSLSRKIFIVKWVTNQLPTGTTLLTRRTRTDAQCPRCDFPDEDARHVLQCPHEGNRRLWEKSITEFEQWMRSIDTDPHIVRAFILLLDKWYYGFITDSYYPSDVSTAVQAAVKDQHKINWENFLTGFWSLHWCEIQDKYYKRCRQRRTGGKWGVKCTSRIWQMFHAHWKHRTRIMLQQQSKEMLRGKDELLWACQLELDIGIDKLDPVYSIYFQTDLDTLNEESLRDIQMWIATIRRAREATGYQYHNDEKISDATRKWVGLSMDKELRRIEPP